MKYEAAGDPVKGTKWTRTTTQKIAEILHDDLDISVSANTVGRLLKDMDYSLKANRKTIPTRRHPERDRQFRIIREIRGKFEKEGKPIISVDAKKREKVGQFENTGKVWTQEAIAVNDHDFPSLAKGVAILYGVYDVLENLGFMFVGTSYETSELAVNSIAKWWRFDGRRRYDGTDELLILADGGGSNGATRRMWKKEIQEKLCDRYGLKVWLCHYPPGASKWNPIEHRLFSEISKNWKGHPLDSYETILNYINTTKTTPGLRVRSYFDPKQYEKGIKVSKEEMSSISLERSDVLGKWNYNISPNRM